MPKAIETGNEPRPRRFWTEAEDAQLRSAILKVEKSLNHRPHHWHLISKQVEGRTNKDCRKRWYAHMERRVNRGRWSSQEDQKLLETVTKWGTS
ncbi:hypothetical protein DACRYDRAFT_52004 [Dacryopinax primogenitus]|uniref:Homeodomain-like protein n=1 Tax=Dacryopinax primogenitus (strain DJM 731) TaxID=1858805 RepID=M5GCG6_DACPD|nr:uncharacterized protein DACRYDRAFT_52004 [Dacryopinax primogenitus]EJU01763.1 hypothetical protein DACRYDRAFT_52004 [Dacryopinax primogenitus]